MGRGIFAEGAGRSGGEELSWFCCRRKKITRLINFGNAED